MQEKKRDAEVQRRNWNRKNSLETEAPGRNFQMCLIQMKNPSLNGRWSAETELE